MKTFWQLTETLYQTDLSKLEGDPQIDVDWVRGGNWSGPSTPTGNFLLLTYRWKGYEVLPVHKSYSKSNQFASLSLAPDRDMPGYFYVDGVDVAKPFRREGFATDLYNKALEVLQAAGHKGIVSYKSGRRPDSDRLWDALRTREDDKRDFKEWLKETHGEMEMPAWDDKRPLNVKIQVIRRNSAYDEITDDQLEWLLDYLVAEDITQMEPQKAFDDANDLSFAVSAGLAGGGDVDWAALSDYDDKDD